MKKERTVFPYKKTNDGNLIVQQVINNEVLDKEKIYIKCILNNCTNEGSLLIDCRWTSGIWKNGTWKDGIWINGTWEDGVWVNGIFLMGTWDKGTWIDGSWIDGDYVNRKPIPEGVSEIDGLPIGKDFKGSPIQYYFKKTHLNIIDIDFGNFLDEES